MSDFSSFFKKLLIIIGIILILLAIFIGIRIYLNNQKEDTRRQEAQKIEIPLEEAQKIDLGGVREGDFMLINEPVSTVAAPSPQQWQSLLKAIKKGTALPLLLPAQSPFTSIKLGSIRYAVEPGSYRLLLDCRSTIPEEEKNNCGAVSISASTLSEEKRAVAQKVIDVLAQEPAVNYAKHHLKGTEGMDKPIRSGNLTLVYNEFCSDIGCNASVSFLMYSLEVKVEGSGNLEPWFTALAQKASQEMQTPR